jgi:hypothetical protein
MGVWYCTRESVKSAVDVRDSVRANAQIDRIIEDVSRGIENSTCRRVFHPRIMTQTWDWPDEDRPTPWRIWLGGKSELISVSAVSSGGVSIATSAVELYPTYGPPYTRVELDRSTTASFTNAGTPQDAISITGLYGGAALDERAVGTIAEDLDTSETLIDVSDVSVIGVGSLLRCDTERMIVTGTRALDTGVNLAANIAATNATTAVTLSTTTAAPEPGEVVTIDTERMLVLDRISTTLTVQRAYDGTVLAAHTTPADIYVHRTLVVQRGVSGTTAATHTSGASLLRWYPPGPVEGLAVAESLNQLEQEKSAYARVIGSGEGQREARGAGLADKRCQVRKAYGRRVRMGAV